MIIHPNDDVLLYHIIELMSLNKQLQNRVLNPNTVFGGLKSDSWEIKVTIKKTLLGDNNDNISKMLNKSIN